MDRIRPLVPEDYRHAGRIYFCAVHEGARNVYSLEQRIAWGRETIDLEGWKEKIAPMEGFVAEEAGEPVGFMTIDETGYIDLAFVLPSCARQGVGAALLQAVEERARTYGVTVMTTEASFASHPFFARHGWVIVEPQTVLRGGVALDRYHMQKVL